EQLRTLPLLLHCVPRLCHPHSTQSSRGTELQKGISGGPVHRKPCGAAGLTSDGQRYRSHSGSMRPTERRKTSLGAAGRRTSVRPASLARRFSLRELQRRQAATTLSHVCWPPRDRGI